MKWVKIVTAGALVSAVACGFMFLRDRSRSRDEQSAAAASELADVRKELASLRGQVRLSGSLMASTIPTTESDTVDEPPEESLPPEDTAEQRASANRPEPTVAEIQQRRLMLFREEAVDAAWKRDAEWSARQQVLEGLPAQARAGEVECRSSMCRVEVVHQDFDSYQTYVGKMLDNAQRAWKGPVMGSVMERLANGTVVAEHYYVRPGSDPMGVILAQHQAELE